MKLEKCNCIMCEQSHAQNIKIVKNTLDTRIKELEEKVDKLLEILALDLSSK